MWFFFFLLFLWPCDSIRQCIPLSLCLPRVLNFWKVLRAWIQSAVYWNNVRNLNSSFCLENFTTSPLFWCTAAQILSRNNKTLSKGQTKECRPSYIHVPTSYWSSHIKGASASLMQLGLLSKELSPLWWGMMVLIALSQCKSASSCFSPTSLRNKARHAFHLGVETCAFT